MYVHGVSTELYTVEFIIILSRLDLIGSYIRPAGCANVIMCIHARIRATHAVTKYLNLLSLQYNCMQPQSVALLPEHTLCTMNAVTDMQLSHI